MNLQKNHIHNHILPLDTFLLWVAKIRGGIRQLDHFRPGKISDCLSLALIFLSMMVMLGVLVACGEKCNLLNSSACGLHNCEGNSWSPDETQGNGDNLSLKSGQVNMIGSSRLCMKAYGPDLITFVWKVDPTAGHVATLSFWDGDSQVKVCDSKNWSQVSYSLRENREYELSWRFQKTKSYPEGAGAGWIDDLIVLNETPYEEGHDEKDAKAKIDISYSNQSTKAKDNSDDINNTIRIPQEGREIYSYGDIFINSSNIIINISNLNISSIIWRNISSNIVSTSEIRQNSSDISNLAGKDRRPQNAVVGICDYPNDSDVERFSTIQMAIDGIRPGGTVFICNGSYAGPIIVNKSLTLKGDNNSSAIICGSNDIISIVHMDVSIKNISILGDNNLKTNGLAVKNADNFSIIDCEINNCGVGINIQNTKKVTINNNIIKRGRAYFNCSCSENKLFGYIGIALRNSSVKSILDNNISINGDEQSTESNLIGIQVDNEKGEMVKLLKNIYITNEINGSDSCYRFWCTEGRKYIPDRTLGVFA